MNLDLSGQDFTTLTVRREDSVEWVTLDRPDRLNALNDAMIAELTAYFTGLVRRPEIRIVVLRGVGRAFCAGLDITADLPADAYEVERLLEKQASVAATVLAMRRAPQAIISLVHGAACGGGLALALASDVRIAGESARMNAAFVRVGLSACDMGVSYFLPRLIGASVAAELMLTGNFIEAPRALAVGLVSSVVRDDQLGEAARSLIEPMLACSPIGLRMTKECLAHSIDAPHLEAAIAMENRTQVLAVSSGAFAQAAATFRAKHKT